MSRPIAALGTWLDGRSARERRMLAIMAVALGLFVLWFAIVAPTLAWKAGAAERRDRAEADHAILAAALDRGAGPRGRDAAGLQGVAEPAAASAGVAATFETVGPDRLRFTVASASTAALFAWLAALEQQGLSIELLGVTENADATLQAEGELVG